MLRHYSLFYNRIMEAKETMFTKENSAQHSGAMEFPTLAIAVTTQISFFREQFTSFSCISSAAVTLFHCTAAAERRFLASEFGVKIAHRNAKIMMQAERISAILQLFFHSVPPLLSIIIQSLNLMLKMHYSQPSMHNSMEQKQQKFAAVRIPSLVCELSTATERERDV